jgi:predicted nucleotide-binding protein
MINFNLTKLELENIIKNIAIYSSSPVIATFTDKVYNFIQMNTIITFEEFEYCCRNIYDWYNKNINEILANFYVTDKDAHIENKDKLEDIIKDIDENREEYSEFFKNIDKSISTTHNLNVKNLNNAKDIFIVHGRDSGVKSEVARMLEKLNLRPIILHEQVNEGSTIIEKIEKLSNDVGFGIVIYTPCDVGALNDKSGEIKYRGRARQNVVLEHGYLTAKLGRKNVCALVKGDVETPNDISGLVYTVYNESGGWKYEIAKELKNAGYEIDLNVL